MKKVIILLGFMLLLSTVILAQESENYVIIEEPTNVRSAPHRVYTRYAITSIVRGVVSNTNLPVTGRNFEDNPACTGIWYTDSQLWLRVDLYGIEGWVKFCDNDFVGDVTSLPIVEAVNPDVRLCFDVRSELDQLGVEPTSAYVVGTTKANFINVRDLPDIASPRFDILTSDEVYVVGRSADNVWFKVSYHAVLPICGWARYEIEPIPVEGWVAGFLLDLPDGWQDIVPVVES